MTLHSRFSAFAALVITASLGVAVLATTGQFRTKDLSHATLEELEKKIVGSQDGQLWLAYGDKLMQTQHVDAAVKAYQKAITYQPDSIDARVNLGLALGQGKDPEAFFDYVSRLCVNYPKLADDLMKRPELASLQGHPRWATTAASARAQALD